MKKIIVYQEGVEKIELLDNDDGNILSFAQSLSNVLKSSTVSIINASDTALIVKPSKVISILIKDQSNEVKITPQHPKPKKVKKKVDIITDVD